MGVTCKDCGTENRDGATFCSMCKAVFGKRASSALPAQASGLELAIDPVRSPTRGSVPPTRNARRTIETRSFALAGGYVASLEQTGSTLSVNFSAATFGGMARAVMVGAIGVVCMIPMLHAETGDELILARFVGAFGALVLAFAVIMLGLTIVHRFDATNRTVERRRSWMGVPVGTWRGTVDRGARLELEIGVQRRRNVPPTHRLTLKTDSGDTLVAYAQDMTDLRIVANEIAYHLELPAPRNV